MEHRYLQGKFYFDSRVVYVPKKFLSIVIPAYNEAKRLPETLDWYIEFFSNVFGKDFEIIIVSDGCQDETPKIASLYAEKYTYVKHLNFPKRLGKGRAVTEGFRIADGEIVGFVDADGSVPPESICKMIKYLDESWDGVIASRWMDGSRVVIHEPFLRKIASRAFNFLIRILFGIRFKDTQCGAKFFKRSALNAILSELYVSDFSFDVELLYRLLRGKFHVKEVPVMWKYRGGSKINIFRTSFQMLVSVVGLRLKFSRLYKKLNKKLINTMYKVLRRL